MQLKNIKGVGDKTLFKLKKIGIENIDDLVRFMPKFYWDMTKESDLRNCDHGDYVLLRGVVTKKSRPVNIRRGMSIFKADYESQGKQGTHVRFGSLPFVGNRNCRRHVRACRLQQQLEEG